MIKTISTKQVVVGMYIHALKGAWVDHPFWKTKFVLDDIQDLKKLQSSVVKEVVIDTSKGLDVPEAPATHASTGEPDENAIQVNVEAIKVEKTSIEQELQNASKIVKESKRAVASMFKDARLGKVVNVETAMSLVEEIAASIDRNEGALISLVRLKTKDDYTYMHSIAVCAMMTALAKELGLGDTEIRQAGLAGLMHDIGKADVPLDILNKPGALTDQEFTTVKLHPEKGHALLLKASIGDPVTLDVCLHHHEKIDGSGYPKRLKGDQISVFAKMGAVCDVYDAVTSNRPYKVGWEPGMSLQRMAQWKNHFDQIVFKAFVKSIGIYPIGSVVILKSGRLAVVVDQSTKSLLQPIVKVFFSTKSKSRIQVETVDLSKPSAMDEIIGHESAHTWGIHDVHELWTPKDV
ncbi:HD-GYP domain-containing protein [Methylotenera sp. N17]|jgi:HD-GYP domain-containing protein (c-di-GMP phosphodiesterase class II)|uniref:HD-GYP domain-containing protein n=1 Tax=Methylotenera sp. N17 TaxID=1502761 RepID=UPI000645AFD8|nr:HD-GYP domain-containing protein [Methylotenera sp. N17]